MSCSSCNSVSCSGCADITVELPNNNIQGIVDNGDGTFTITLDSGATTTITPTATPNDTWVTKDETTISTALVYTGDITANTTLFDLQYKVLNIDTVIVMFHGDFNVTTVEAGTSINFTFGIGNITSNWYAGNKKTSTMISAVQTHTPVIITRPGQEVIPNYTARAYSSTTNLIGIADSYVDLPNGTHDIDIDFQIICKLV